MDMPDVRDHIDTLVSEPCDPTTSGFAAPFTVDRLCLAFGENLGGNRPRPEWFEGFDVLCAVRRTMDADRLSAVAAVLRRRSDGALRLVASDHVRVRGEPGADFMLARRHSDIVSEAIMDASDDGPCPAAERMSALVRKASDGRGEGPVDLLSVRRMRDDLADERARRDIVPAAERLREQLSRLSSPDRRAKTLRLLEAIEAEIA